MDDPTIVCPKCKTEIRLTESLAAPLVEATRMQFQQRLDEKDAAVEERIAELDRQRDLLASEKEAIDQRIAEKVEQQRTTIAASETEKAREAAKAELEARSQETASLRLIVEQQESKLAESQKAQLELLKQKRELDDAKRELELTIETRLQQSLNAARQEARREADETLGLRVREREETIAAMQRQIEELKRKSEQGSQQLQGEVLELELESLVRNGFPLDGVEPVPKGEFGGDLIQRVFGPGGKACGAILWEMKRTRNWSDGWLAKLRTDQRAANADVAILVSAALPKDIESFGLIDGVWVTAPRCAVPVAIALRELLTSVAAARTSTEGQAAKTELVYTYLTGPRFRHRVEAIVEQFTEMQSDLDRERKSITKLWARREQQIRTVVESTAGMYGDLQGIAGRSIQEIAGLDFPMLGGPEQDD